MSDTTDVISLGYQARPQFVPFHTRCQRWACLVAHRRAGKTVACIADLVDAAMRCEEPSPRFAYVAPLFVQAKDVAWSYLKRFTAPIPGVQFNEAELRVDLPGDRRIRLYGADNYDRMRGLYLDGVILDEVADMPPGAWGEVIRPALADRRGWAVFIGTPKGRNAFYETWQRAQNNPDWFSAILRASETGLLPQAELDGAAAEMTPEQYEQEFECSFEAAILGAYFGREMADAEAQNRITAVKAEPNLPVHTAWDLGMGDSMAIWCWQIAAGQIRVLDHIESSGHGLDYYVKELNAHAAENGWRWGDDYVPHDARVRELGTGRSRVETLISLGRKPRLVPASNPMDRINAARLTLARTWFNHDTTREGCEALRQYRAEYDEKARTFRDRPKHDWSSHSADAYGHLALAWREMAPEQPKPPPRVLAVGPANTVTFDDLWDTAPATPRRI